jgi:hypothetical protein
MTRIGSAAATSSLWMQTAELPEFAPLEHDVAVHMHSTAIDLIEAIASREAIACDFERIDRYLFVPPSGASDCSAASSRRAGLSQVALVPRAPLAFDTGASACRARRRFTR